jgi:hypothetical protein
MMLPLVRSGVLVAAVATAVAACGHGDDSASPPATRTAPAEKPVAVASSPSPSLAVSPSEGGKHDRFTVAITSRHATGVFGKTRRAYSVEAHAVRPAVACVNNRDERFPDRPAGTRVHAALAAAPGEGGSLGWCRGRFRGTVTYTDGFACPAAGTCHPEFPTRSRVVARVSFRVR